MGSEGRGPAPEGTVPLLFPSRRTRSRARARSQTWPPWRTAAPLLALGFLGWGSRAGLLPPGGYLRTPPSPRPARSATAPAVTRTRSERAGPWRRAAAALSPRVGSASGALSRGAPLARAPGEGARWGKGSRDPAPRDGSAWGDSVGGLPGVSERTPAPSPRWRDPNSSFSQFGRER